MASYPFSDKAPLTGTNFYRLQMSDIDGRYTYSPVRSVSIGNGGNSVYSLYPNPASGSTWLNSTAVVAESITISILDNNGRKIRRKNDVVSSAAAAKISLSNITPGMYFLKIVSARGSSTQKLIVQ